MRTLASLCLLLLAISPALAQSRSVVLRDAPRRPSVSAHLATDHEPPGVWTVLGTSALGGAIGGGIGALIGTIAPEALARDGGAGASEEPDALAVFPFGVWIGTTVGAVAGAEADIDGSAPYLSGVGSVMGSIFGLLAGTAVAGDRPGGFPIGFAVGATVGAALPAWAEQRSAKRARRRRGRLQWQGFVRPVRVAHGPGVAPGVGIRARF